MQSYITNLQKYKYVPQVIDQIINMFDNKIIEFSTVYSRICLVGFLLEQCRIEKGWKKKIISKYIYYLFEKEEE